MWKDFKAAALNGDIEAANEMEDFETTVSKDKARYKTQTQYIKTINDFENRDTDELCIRRENDDGTVSYFRLEKMMDDVLQTMENCKNDAAKAKATVKAKAKAAKEAKAKAKAAKAPTKTKAAKAPVKAKTKKITKAQEKANAKAEKNANIKAYNDEIAARELLQNQQHTSITEDLTLRPTRKVWLERLYESYGFDDLVIRTRCIERCFRFLEKEQQKWEQSLGGNVSINTILFDESLSNSLTALGLNGLYHVMNDVKRAYFKKMKSCHPDKNPDVDTTKKAQVVTNAWDKICEYYGFE
jgi:hypothetical protein